MTIDAEDPQRQRAALRTLLEECSGPNDPWVFLLLRDWAKPKRVKVTSVSPTWIGTSLGEIRFDVIVSARKDERGEEQRRADFFDSLSPAERAAHDRTTFIQAKRPRP